MEQSEMPYTDNNREIMNDWNYDGSFTFTTLLVWDLKILCAWVLRHRCTWHDLYTNGDKWSSKE